MLGAETPAPAAETLAGWLVGAVERRDAKDYRLMEGRNTVGASPKNNIVIDDDSMSSNHAAVICQGGTYFVEDNSSTNGTTVNGRRVSRSELGEGDAIAFGTYALTFYPFKKRQA
jgi:pSer/pThr/pTyr-binding forkhead associated (FHA) protein